MTAEGLSAKVLRCVLVLCHNRPRHLELCLESLFAARGSNDYAVVVVRQLGDHDVGQVLARYRDRLSLIIELEGHDKVEESIRRNRFLGYFACYQTLDAEIVLAVEDDVQIATDALEFVEEVYLRHRSDRDFMGINLGSVEPRSLALSDSYSLLRYGIHGQASVLSKRTWNVLLRSQVVIENPGGHFDSAVEPLLRGGYMVTPNNSRHLDVGYGGTHAPNQTNGDYFSRIAASWVGTSVEMPLTYRLKQVKHHWREDAVPYRRWQNFYYKRIEPFRRLHARR